MVETSAADRLSQAYADMQGGREEKAREAFERLAREGDLQAEFYLAWMDENGWAGPKDETCAAERYRVLADNGNDLASYHLASLRFRQGDAERALPYFLRASNSGNASATYWASAIYGGAGGFPANLELEHSYLVRASKLGHMFARRDLARQRMQNAKGLSQWILAAFAYWYVKAAGMVFVARNVNDLRVR